MAAKSLKDKGKRLVEVTRQVAEITSPRETWQGNASIPVSLPTYDLVLKPPAPAKEPRRVSLREQPVALPAAGEPPGPPPPPSSTSGVSSENSSNPFVDFVVAYRDRPVEFVRNVLHADPLPWQEDFLRAIARGERRVSVRAGHGVGKSTACAWAILWHLLTRFPQKTVCTAPTASQLYDALFSEVKSWINKLPDYLKSLFEVKAERIEYKGAPEESFASARTASPEKPEALAGIHSEHVLLIADEASAIPEPIFESAAGSMSGHNATTVLIGNPTRNSGMFYLTHHGLRDDWFTMHVSCADPAQTRLVNPDFIRQIAATYGVESNAYRVRVLGEFALRDDDTLIAAELVDAAMVREVPVDDLTPMVYGLDVARFGDDRSVLCKRQGNTIIEFKVWRGLDLMQLVGAVVNEAMTDLPSEIMVDSIGLGSGVADRLRELKFNVSDVNVSESAAMNPQANRLRDDLWLQVRDWLRSKACQIPKMDDLRQELVSPTYKFTSSGKLQVESKESMKKRGLKSPDMADALCLTFAGTAAMVGGRVSKWGNGPLKRGIRGIV